MARALPPLGWQKGFSGVLNEGPCRLMWSQRRGLQAWQGHAGSRGARCSSAVRVTYARVSQKVLVLQTVTIGALRDTFGVYSQDVKQDNTCLAAPEPLGPSGDHAWSNTSLQVSLQVRSSALATGHPSFLSSPCSQPQRDCVSPIAAPVISTTGRST